MKHFDRLDCFVTILRFPDHGDSWAGIEHGTQALSEHGVVIYQEHGRFVPRKRLSCYATLVIGVDTGSCTLEGYEQNYSCPAAGRRFDAKLAANKGGALSHAVEPKPPLLGWMGQLTRVEPFAIVLNE
jgi:hypothetical protein